MGALFGRSRRQAEVDASGTPLDSLLEEMRDLRLTLAADLNAAAGAAEAGADAVAADIVEADRRELARFARVADQRLLRLQKLAVAGPEAPTWRRRVVVALPVLPVVGAMALSAAAATGVLPLPGGHHSTTTPNGIVQQGTDGSPASSSFRDLVDVLGNDPSASQVIAAASKFHHQLARLIASSPDNPQRAATIAEFLRMEQSLLIREQPPGAKVVLNATRKLAARLVTANPTLTTPTAVPSVLPSVAPSRHTTHKSPSPSATPKQSASPKPSHSPSSKPSGSPSPSGTPFPPALPN